MFPPCFFSLKMLTTGNTGKELRWTPFKIDSWITRRVIKPAHQIFCFKIGQCLLKKMVQHITPTIKMTFLSAHQGEMHCHKLDHS